MQAYKAHERKENSMIDVFMCVSLPQLELKLFKQKLFISINY